ncbi:leucine-rich repeat-containing protein 74B-like isoform X1 [Biomphalaria glabrata]|uniref:Leucine-rich repeat-containing protein 74B-like isoform X1 n=1 Tax=Biomphalaria glabrata TaxID=6526 RepID=A0A9W3A9N9_BIOGL|nr:leucine-rich repeat-containing protein 74B-like isoform X1 [Biomphalaria glabrata]XP_055884053.1 leucine-rich repeat-containing protein 74B-like isoform X1 [Biomphalaria glabrata]
MEKQELDIKMQRHLRALSAGPKRTPKVYPKNKHVRATTAVGKKPEAGTRIGELLKRPHLRVPTLRGLASDESPDFPDVDSKISSPITLVKSIDGHSSEQLTTSYHSPPTDKKIPVRKEKVTLYPTLHAWQTDLANSWDQETPEEVDLSDKSNNSHIIEEDPLGKEKYKQFCQHYDVEPISYLTRHLGDHVVRIKHRCIATNKVKPLALALQVNTFIQTLDLTDNHIDSIGAQHLAHMLKENQTLVSLNLSNNNIGSEGLAAICDMLELNTTLKDLSLAGNHLGDKDGYLFIDPLKNNTSLTGLNLSHNEFSITGAIHIGRALAVNESLTDVDISWNSLRRQGAVAIANALRLNKTMELLDLSWNGFGIEGTTALQRSLSVNKTLKMLDLSNNRLDHDCAKKLCFGLKKNVALETLSLNRNPLSEECVQRLLKVMESHASFNFLSIEGLVVSKSTVELLQKLPVFKEKVVLQGDIGRLNREMVLESLKKWFCHFKDKRANILHDVTRLYDSKSSGVLSIEDFKICLRTAGCSLPKGYLDLLVQSLDFDHTRTINYREIFTGEKLNKGEKPKVTFPLLMNTELEDLDGDV